VRRVDLYGQGLSPLIWPHLEVPATVTSTSITAGSAHPVRPRRYLDHRPTRPSRATLSGQIVTIEVDETTLHVYARSRGDPRGTTTTTPSISLTVHPQASLLTHRHRPLLCTAVLDSLIDLAPTKNALARAGKSPRCQQQELLPLGQMGRCGISSISRRTYRASPGSRARRRTRQFHRGLPPVSPVVRLRQIDGMPHEPQRTRSTPGAVTGPVERREVSRNLEK
jgi:hypothetical protein